MRADDLSDDSSIGNLSHQKLPPGNLAHLARMVKKAAPKKHGTVRDLTSMLEKGKKKFMKRHSVEYKEQA